MTFKKEKGLMKLPVIKQYLQDKEKLNQQNEYLKTLYSNTVYVEKDPTLIDWIKEVLPGRKESYDYVTDTFPSFKWIPRYNFQWLLGDLIAGLTVGAVMVPKSMAYANLAHLPVQYGLYTSIFGGATYWLLGTSKDIVVGPVAVASMITAQIVSNVQTELKTENIPAPIIASSLAMLAGILIFLLGLLRLGWLVNLISLPAVAAFITGSSITASLAQFPFLLGIKNINTKEPAVKLVINIFKHLKNTNIDAAIGLSALTTLYIVKWSSSFAAKRRPNLAKQIFFLQSLRTVTVILIFTIISYILNRHRKDHPVIHVIGYVPKGINRVSVPKFNKMTIGKLLNQLPLAVIVMLVELIATGKEFGRINGYNIDPSSEMLAVGLANIAGPLIGGFFATGSVSSTAINSKAGAKTPLSGAFTAIVVIISIYTLEPAFFFVPISVLAAIIIHAIGDLITPPTTLYEFWKISPTDSVIFVIGLVIILVDSTENGVYVMIALSLAVLMFRSFQANGTFLGSVEIQSNLTSTVSKSSSEPSSEPKPVPLSTLEITTVTKPKATVESTADAQMTNLLLKQPIFDSSNEEINNVFNKSEHSSLRERKIFLQLDHKDGSSPKLRLVSPEPGIFIYRFKNGFNYINCEKQLDYMVKVVKESTNRSNPLVFKNSGSILWNETRLKSSSNDIEKNSKTKLEAIIFDFSTVDSIDLTAVQYLVAIRNILENYAAPIPLQWHFACVSNKWTRRALSSVGFGFPSLETADGSPTQFKPIYSMATISQNSIEDGRTIKREPNHETHTLSNDDIGNGNLDAIIGLDKDGQINVEEVEKFGVTRNDRYKTISMNQIESVYGMNRPFFHPDIESALISARNCISVRKEN